MRGFKTLKAGRGASYPPFPINIKNFKNFFLKNLLEPPLWNPKSIRPRFRASRLDGSDQKFWTFFKVFFYSFFALSKHNFYTSGSLTAGGKLIARSNGKTKSKQAQKRLKLTAVGALAKQGKNATLKTFADKSFSATAILRFDYKLRARTSQTPMI